MFRMISFALSRVAGTLQLLKEVNFLHNRLLLWQPNSCLERIDEMCGISGIMHTDQAIPVDQEILRNMVRVIHHRGPDDYGIWQQGPVGIGMARLSIIDRAGGHQPMHNEDKSCWIVFNGEIYNFQDLRIELLAKGHDFLTSSDTETILHLYEEYGEDCVRFLRGMFAFAIFDTVKKKLFIARDRLGVKPLHYFFDGKHFVFGSEIKSILASCLVKREFLPSALVNYFFYGYTPDPDTMFAGIHKLPPGHTLVLRQGAVTLNRYWQVHFEEDNRHNETYFVDRTLEIMEEAVRIRLVSEVPLGAFLSGGIDSSLVVALMARQMGEPVKTFSIGFEDQDFNELAYARMVAKQYGTDHHEEIVRPDAEKIILDLVRQFDEPFADSSAIPTYYVSKMTKKWVTVSLSGDGGDELFAGYTRYQEGRLPSLMRHLPGFIRKGIFRNLATLLPQGFYGTNTLRYWSCSDEEQIIWKYTKMLALLHEDIFSSELKARVATTDPASALLSYLRKVQEKDRVTRMQYLDLHTYLPGDIMAKVDRTSMMVSLEAREPLLDHHLVEFAATIPACYKIKNGETKYILKKVAERLLPRELIYRPKQGFAVPIHGWIKKEWAEMSHELLLGQRAMARKNFNPIFLRRIMDEHQRGRRDHSYIIWTLMVLELWFREFID